MPIFKKLEWNNTYLLFFHRWDLWCCADKNHCQNKSYFFYVSFYEFYSFASTDKSLIIFELFCMMVMWSLYRLLLFLFFTDACSCDSTIYWKEFLCSTELSLLLCQRSVDYIYVSLFMEHTIQSHSSICLFFHQYQMTLDYCSFIISLAFAPLSKIIGYIYCESIYGLYSVSLIYLSTLLLIPNNSWLQ